MGKRVQGSALDYLRSGCRLIILGAAGSPARPLNFTVSCRLSLGAPRMNPRRRTAFTAAVLIPLAGCVTANSPLVTSQLQTISAGHTGCMPEDNQLSNV